VCRETLAALKELGSETRAEPGAEDDPDQREGGRDEPLLPADEGRQGDEAERDQVDFGHTVERLLASSDSWPQGEALTGQGCEVDWLPLGA
jgi:hypothetical protein